MKDETKTKKQLIKELEDLRKRIEAIIASKLIPYGEETAILGVVTDITERKKGEDALRTSEDKFSKAFRNNPDSLYITTIPEGKFVDVNPAFEKISGYGRDEVLGKTVIELDFYISPDDREKLFQRLQKNGRLHDYEIFLRIKSGEILLCRVFSEVIEIQGKPHLLSIVRDITEQKKAEDELRSSEARLKILFEYAPDAYYLSDLKGNFIDGNIAAEDLLGYKRSDLIGKSFLKLKLLSAKETSKAAKFLAKNVLGKATGPDEFTLHRKDGTSVITEIRTYPVKIKDQTLVLGIARDITERKRAEEALRESEEKYRGIFESLHDVYYRTDKEGNVTIISPSVRSQAGYNPEDIIGHQVTDFYLNPSDREYFKTKLKESGVINDYELKLLAKDGRVIDVSISSQIIFGSNGEPVGVEGVLRDITERKQVEDALKKSEAYLTYQIQRMPIGHILWDTKFRATSWNPTAEEIFGFSQDEALGRHPYDLIVPKEAQPIVDDIWGRLLKGDTTAHSINENITKDGRTIICQWSNTPLKDADGTCMGVLSMIQDITERKKAAEKLKESLKKLQTAISGNIQLMAATVEIRDPYTAGHQRRVADLARAIATEMALSEDQVEGIHMAGVIHDIGKISVPSEILSKPGKLTEIEFGLIKIHPQVGFDILREIEFPWPLAQIVYQHHERMDGLGYPQGLSGEKILLEARIMCVADVVEAMASHRPYRPALGIDVALEEIKKNKGKLYDPDVSDACLNLFAENKFKFTD